MKRFLNLVLTTGIALGAIAIAPGGVAAADARCSSHAGVTIHEDINQGGSHTDLCAPNGSNYNGDLSKLTDGLFWLANWDNWISSYEVFNFTGGRSPSGWTRTKGGRFLQTYNTSHEYVNSLNFSFGNYNDLFSSVRIS
jgi:hypothetical protein